MNVNNLFRAAVIGSIVSTSTGCQSWQGAPFPMQNATRVPPPGTGTYQLPSGYYPNATSALPATTTTQTAASAPGLRPATGTFPSTNLPATNLAAHIGPQANPAPVVAAAHVQPLSGDPSSQFTAPPLSSAASAVGSSAAGMNEAVTTEVPSLQWQQFGGQ